MRLDFKAPIIPDIIWLTVATNSSKKVNIGSEKLEFSQSSIFWVAFCAEEI
jgi:hypothetical protein